MNPQEYFDQAICDLKSKNMYRSCHPLESAQHSRVQYQNKTYVLFGSNNYLGLNTHPEITQACTEATCKYGTGAGGSRLTTGTTMLHEQLEMTIANFKNTESAIVFNNGYMANLGVISSLTNSHWTVLSDKLNHASIVDGTKLSDARTLRYKTRNRDDLEKKIEKTDTPYKMIITDGVFSMDGRIAPLSDIACIASNTNALVVVDDAHGLGVLGTGGRGTASELGLSEQVDLHVGTLSKSIPASGGYIAGKKVYIDWIRNQARSYIYTTALPPGVIAAAIRSFDIVEKADPLRMQLQENIHRLKTGLRRHGISVHADPTPIVPIVIGSSEKTMHISRELLSAGFFVPGIRPPTVQPKTSRLRVSLMATHTAEDIDIFLSVLGPLLKKYGVV